MGITIESPEVTLLRNPAGEWNYSSLANRSVTPQPATGGSGLPGDFSIQKFVLSDGRVILGSTASGKRSTYDHVNVEASQVALTTKFPLTVAADLPEGGKFKLTGNLGPVDPTNTALTPLDAKLEVNGLNLASTGLLDRSAGLGGLVDMNATLKSQDGAAETAGTVILSKALLVAGGSPASVPVTVDFSTRYDLRKNSGILEPSTVKIGNAAAHLNGTFDTGGEVPTVSAKVQAKDMPARDLQAFLPALGINLPTGASLQAGTLNVDLNASGPADKLITSGSVGLFAAKLAGFDLGSKMSAVSALAGLKTGKDLDIEKLTTNLQMTPGGLKAENFLAVIPSLGNLAGGGTVDAKNNLDFKMTATLTNAIGAVASPVTGVASLLGAKGGCKSGTAVPFRIQGTTANPKFVPDVGGLASGMIKSQVGCATGAVSGTAKGQNPAGALSGISGLFGKKKKP